MNSSNVPYLIPYLVSAAISFSIALYAWQRRSVPGAAPFTVVAFSQTVWTMGYIFELGSPSLTSKIFWDDLQFLAMVIWPLAFLAFAQQFCGRKFKRPFLTWGLIVMPMVVFALLLLTNDAHKLIRESAKLLPGEPFDALFYDFTTAVWLSALYAYGLILSGIYLLITHFTKKHRLYRKQMYLVILGTLIPIVGTFLTLVNITFTFQRDTTPITFAVSNLIIAWGLFRYRLFDVAPVARDAVFEGMSDYVVVLDQQNRIVDINPAMLAAIGKQADEVIGQSGWAMFATWGELGEQFQEVQQTSTELQVQDQGESRFLSLRIAPLRDGRHGMYGRLIVARDITKRKRAEELLKEYTTQLETANQVLTALSRVKDEFVANVSHELRTPLANIKLYHDLLTLQPEKSQHYLSVLHRETTRLEKLIEDLLALSRLDQEGVALKCALIDMNRLVCNLVEDRQMLVAQHGLQLSVYPAANMPPVNGDVSLIGQVLSILLTNATNYTPAGGVIDVSTGVEQHDGRTWAGFSIHDSGPGISPEEQVNLFARFFRGSAARVGNTAGTGLGLAIAKEIIELHHGRIEVQSKGIPGQGTTFSVWLPI